MLLKIQHNSISINSFGINFYEMKEFEKQVADELKKYPFLKWQNNKTAKLVRKLFRKGYSIGDTVGLVILNN